MDLIGFVCILSFPISLLVCIILTILLRSPISLISVEVGLTLLLIGFFIFKFFNRLYLKKLDDSLLAFSKKISSLSGSKEKNIYFKKIDGFWTCEQFYKKYFFNLDGLFFKKSFIIAFVTRAIRYPFISYQKKVKELGKMRFKIPYKRMPLNVVFIDNGKEKKYKLIKKNISNSIFIAWGITWSQLISLDNKYTKSSEVFYNQIIKLDEYIFKLFI